MLRGRASGRLTCEGAGPRAGLGAGLGRCRVFEAARAARLGGGLGAGCSGLLSLVLGACFSSPCGLWASVGLASGLRSGDVVGVAGLGAGAVAWGGWVVGWLRVKLLTAAGLLRGVDPARHSSKQKRGRIISGLLWLVLSWRCGLLLAETLANDASNVEQ